MLKTLIVTLLFFTGLAWADVDASLRVRRDKIEKTSNYQEGYKAAEEAFQELHKSGHPLSWDFHSLMAVFSSFIGQYDRTGQLFAQRPDPASLGPYPLYQYDLAMGRAHQYQGQYTQALTFYESCLKHAKDLDAIRYAVTPVIALAFIHSQQGKTAKVMEYLALLQSYEKDAPDDVRAIIYAESGGLYYDNEDYTKAIAYGKKAVELAEKSASINDLSAMHANLGLYYDAAGDVGATLKHRIRALELAKQSGNPDVVARRLMTVGDTYLGNKDYAAAYSYLKDLPTYFDQAKQVRYQVESRRYLAGALAGLDRCDEALRLFTEARERLALNEVTAKNDLILINILDEERQCQARLKNWETAFQTTDRMLKLERHATEEQNRRGMNEFRIKYDTAIKEQENERLAAKSQLDELALDKERQTNRYYLTITLVLALFVLALAGLLFYIVHILRHLEQAKAMTEMQTVEIAAILGRIDQGIFVVRGSDLLIQPQMSHYARTRFSVNPGEDLPGFLSRNFQLDAETLSIIVNVLGNSIDMSDLGFSIDSSKLPSELSGSGEKDNALFEVDWVPMVRSSDQTVEGYLVCLRDITELRQSQAEQEREQQELKRIGQLVSCGQTGFRHFHKAVQGHLTALEKTADMRQLRQELHTIKGLARMQKFQELSSLCHACEEDLSQGLPQNTQRVRKLFEEYADLAKQKLEWSLDAHGTQSQQLWDVVRQGSHGLSDLARELGKPEPQLLCSGINPAISRAWQSVLPGIIQHLVRNSLDHGLETAEERKARGKAVRGTIRIEARWDHDAVLLEYSDDGAGLDLQRIADRAQKQGLWSEGTAAQLAELIFRSGFSTAGRTTEISGRGVGMDAVRSMAEQQGGSVTIVLENPESMERGRQPLRLHIRLKGRDTQLLPTSA